MLAAVLFVVGNMFLLPRLLAWHRALETKRKSHEATVISSRLWADQYTLWSERETWMEDRVPEMGDLNMVQTALLEELLNASKEFGVTEEMRSIDELGGKPQPGQPQGYGAPDTPTQWECVVALLRCNGSLENVVRLAAALQAPARFQTLTSFEVTPGQDPAVVTCTMKVTRWLKRKTVK
ncbi:hypothetical protein DB346_09180 [Verrucomicrobia bacterium LW23]|nr:hypothetical protein DB346_09180 [Verrucomicrobia bacterium LW23]